MHEIVNAGGGCCVRVSVYRECRRIKSLFGSDVSIEVHFAFVGQANSFGSENTRPGGNHLWSYALAGTFAVSSSSLFR